MKQPWRTGKVIKIADETSNTKRFWIQVPELESFDFEPGQFVTLDLPIHEKPNKRWRSYSIASWPDGSNVFELVIVLLEGGLGTTYLFNEVSVGSELLFRGAQGVFTLHEELDRPLFLICTGTGIAPFRAFLWRMFKEKHENYQFRGLAWLIFGVPKTANILYKEDLEKLAAEFPDNFRLTYAISREQQNAEGGRMYIQHRVAENASEIWQLMQSPKTHTYMCGLKGMESGIEEALSNLASENGTSWSDFQKQMKKEHRWHVETY